MSIRWIGSLTLQDRQRFDVLGVGVDALDLDAAVRDVAGMIQGEDRGYVVFCTASTLVEAAQNEALRSALREATFVMPDGMPLVWIGRRSEPSVGRVYGPDFMRRFLEATDGNYAHFFYGGSAEVAGGLSRRLQEAYPQLRLAGALSPSDVDEGKVRTRDVELINDANPDVVWVGLGHPKQEIWMHRHRQLLHAPVLLGVGAAFDFVSGAKREAPRWMQRSGLQWLHRLLREPRRLWRRYLIGNATFVRLLIADRRRRRPR